MSLYEKIQQAEKGLAKIQAEINSEIKQIKQLQTNKDSCPTCSRLYSSEHVEHVAKLICNHEEVIAHNKKSESKLQKFQKEILLKIESLKEVLKQEEYKKRQYEQQLSENSNTQTSISFLQKSLEETISEIEIINKEQNNNLKGRVATLATEVETSKIKVNELNNDLNILETVKFVISEEGIKSFIVKKILTVLNSRLAFYLKKLEANCLCQFNEFFDEEIVDETSQQKSYFNFSGGERKRIDLACLFAFADIRRLQGDVNFSTVFYDELLDSSLDDRGVYLTLQTLRERFIENNESCYIITHRGSKVTAKAEHTIHVIKKNGISSILA